MTPLNKTTNQNMLSPELIPESTPKLGPSASLIYIPSAIPIPVGNISAIKRKLEELYDPDEMQMIEMKRKKNNSDKDKSISKVRA